MGECDHSYSRHSRTVSGEKRGMVWCLTRL